MEKLKACDACKNAKCKDNGYKYLAHCQYNFMWAVFGVCIAALFVALTASYLITRFVDGAWGSWQLPAILVIAYLAIVVMGAMFCSIKNIKAELSTEESKEKQIAIKEKKGENK